MNIEQLAREAGISETNYTGIWACGTNQLQRFADLVRNAVLEEAVVKLESADVILNLPSVPEFSGDDRPTEKRVLHSIVAVLRAMKQWGLST